MINEVLQLNSLILAGSIDRHLRGRGTAAADGAVQRQATRSAVAPQQRRLHRSTPQGPGRQRAGWGPVAGGEARAGWTARARRRAFRYGLTASVRPARPG
jgi:hypothetical protein